MSRIALFFGSFDPIHMGHIQLALRTIEQGHVQEVEFVLTPQNPSKLQQNPRPTLHRLRLLEIALKKYPTLGINKTEMSLTPPHYTFHSLSHIISQRPKTHFYLLLGEDQYAYLPSWKHAKKLRSLVHMLIYPRAESLTSLSFPLGSGVELIKGPHYPFSSSEIRKQLRDPHVSPKGLPEGTLQYIRKHGIYQDNK
ncbi:MAG: nicotinate (nicotinamide) nucleotide adenylyltransferase [Cytophagales bacterium]|nr:nicotinate (nicotinamide) nucleotide adenylyltransferase [Cytophagales bacterium]